MLHSGLFPRGVSVLQQFIDSFFLIMWVGFNPLHALQLGPRPQTGIRSWLGASGGTWVQVYCTLSHLSQEDGRQLHSWATGTCASSEKWFTEVTNIWVVVDSSPLGERHICITLLDGDCAHWQKIETISLPVLWNIFPFQLTSFWICPGSAWANCSSSKG